MHFCVTMKEMTLSGAWYRVTRSWAARYPDREANAIVHRHWYEIDGGRESKVGRWAWVSKSKKLSRDLISSPTRNSSTGKIQNFWYPMRITLHQMYIMCFLQYKVLKLELEPPKTDTCSKKSQKSTKSQKFERTFGCTWKYSSERLDAAEKFWKEYSR